MSSQTALKVALRFHKRADIIVFAVTFISLCALTLLNLWSLSTVKGRLLLGDRYYDLLNNILEMRRFEKNLLFYNDVASIREGRYYFKLVDSIAS